MFNLNLLLQRSYLISGNYDGERIIKTKSLHFLHVFITFLFFFECISTLIVVLNPELGYYLTVLHLTDGLIQRLWNICISLVHLSFAFNHLFFYQFNTKPEYLKFLNYLLCKSESELRIKYQIDKITSIQIFDMISLKKNGLIRILHDLLPYCYIFITNFLLAGCIYLAYMNTSKIGFYFLAIPTSLLLYLAFLSSSHSVGILYLIFFTNCKLIGFRIDDLNRKLKKLIIYEIVNKNKIYARLRIAKREKFDIMRQIDSILRFHQSNQYFANGSITGFYLCVLAIALFFPYIMLFDTRVQNNPVYQAVLVIMYCITIGFTSYSIILASELVYSKFKKLRNLKFTYLMYSDNLRKKIKFLNSIQDSDDQMYFNCCKIFKYKNSFLLFWIIESISMVFLIYGAQNL